VSFVFAGTPQFAAWVLADLDGLSRRPSLVISQPDKPTGRGRRSTPPPAVVEAQRLGLECLQTGDINSPAVRERLRSTGASTLVVAAFGQILKRPLLESALCLNVHASLLPAYRGAAPIERALAAGESCTGISIMRMTEGLDEGPWALRTSLSVGLRDDAGSLGRVMALLGAVGLDQVLTGISEGTAVWTEQSGAGSYAAKLTEKDHVVDFGRGAKVVHDQVRALSPAIGARSRSGSLELKIWRTWPYGQPGLEAVPPTAEAAGGVPGRLAFGVDRLFVGCLEGVVEVLVVQPAGRDRMTGAAFLRGYRDRLCDRLGRSGINSDLSGSRTEGEDT
jgi:methionyl-tRNA formyltransferase